jgi:hypothetical protein
MSHKPKFEVPVSETMASPGRRKDSMAGQRNDWVRCTASLSSGVRGGGRVGLEISWMGVAGSAVERAERSDLMDMFG